MRGSSEDDRSRFRAARMIILVLWISGLRGAGRGGGDISEALRCL